MRLSQHQPKKVDAKNIMIESTRTWKLHNLIVKAGTDRAATAVERAKVGSGSRFSRADTLKLQQLVFEKTGLGL
jgi:hypothetical protein